jgi:cell division protein FtsL
VKAGFFRLGDSVLGKVETFGPVKTGLLLAAVVICALSVVTSQHKARKLFIELQKEKEYAQQMEVEWGQLQLEQSTWATPARVENIAGRQLQMQLPKNGQVQFIRATQPLPQSASFSETRNNRSTTLLENQASGQGKMSVNGATQQQ